MNFWMDTNIELDLKKFDCVLEMQKEQKSLALLYIYCTS